MDRAGQAVFHGRIGIVNRIVSKWHVPDNCVKIVVGKLCFFKTLREYRGVGVEFPGYPGCESVKFNTCSMSSAHRLRHTPEDMPNSHSRLKYLCAVPQAELFQSIPNCLNDKRRCKMRVRGCCTR